MQTYDVPPPLRSLCSFEYVCICFRVSEKLNYYLPDFFVRFFFCSDTSPSEKHIVMDTTTSSGLCNLAHTSKSFIWGLTNGVDAPNLFSILSRIFWSHCTGEVGQSFELMVYLALDDWAQMIHQTWYIAVRFCKLFCPPPSRPLPVVQKCRE